MISINHRGSCVNFLKLSKTPLFSLTGISSNTSSLSLSLYSEFHRTHHLQSLSPMAYPRFRGTEIWWRRLGRRIAVIALGFTIIVFVISLTSDSKRKGIDSNPPSTVSDSDLVHLTLLTNAKDRGAGIKLISSLISPSQSSWAKLQ